VKTGGVAGGCGHGGVDVAAIPIGAYGSSAERWFHKPNHMDPSKVLAIGVSCGRGAKAVEPLLNFFWFLTSAVV